MTRPPRLAEWVMERSLVPADRTVVVGDLYDLDSMHRAASENMQFYTQEYSKALGRTALAALHRAGRFDHTAASM